MESMIDLDRPCEHLNFDASVGVIRLTDTPQTGFVAEIRVRCALCHEPFRWIGGYPVGVLLSGPAAVSPDGYELRAPLAPGLSDPDYGLGLGGFIVRQVDTDVE